MKDLLVSIDQAGRIVLPKNVREELAIHPGDLLKLSVQGMAVTLTPEKEASGLVRKGKALVFSASGKHTLDSGEVNDLLDAIREEPVARVSVGPAGSRRKS